MEQFHRLLDTLDRLLTTEPARLIGYGAAVVITLVVAFLNSQGITRFGADLTFDQSLGLAFAAITTVTLVVESLRRFVYAPATVATEANDSHVAGHEHAEDELLPLIDKLVAHIKATQPEPQPETIRVPVAPAPDGTLPN
jgi:hypothetical protein